MLAGVIFVVLIYCDCLITAIGNSVGFSLFFCLMLVF